MSLAPSDARRRRVVVLVITAVAVVVIAATIVSVVVARGVKPGGPIAIVTGFDGCAREWTNSSGGALTFSVSNSTIDAEDVYLEDPRTHAVYGEVEGLGSNAARTLPVVIGDGEYRFVCVPTESEPIRGAIVTVRGAHVTGPRTPAVLGVTPADLLAPAKQYQQWIQQQLPTLASAVRVLATAVAASDRPSAEAAWQAAHADYETLGAAYGAFGDADTAIDGDPARGSTALEDPDLTGFHKIEAELWGGTGMPSITPVADRLVVDVDALAASFATARISGLDVGLRAHEILEDAIRDQLTATDDAGSHSELATISADVVGTRAALAPLRPLLAHRYPRLHDVDAALAAVDRLLATLHHADGSWDRLDELDRATHARLDAALDESVELLAPVAVICDPRPDIS